MIDLVQEKTKCFIATQDSVTKDTVARMTAAAEREKIDQEVERLVQEKKKKPDVAHSSPSISRGLIKTVPKPVYAKGNESP